MKKYRTALEPVWCKGCGNYALLDAITRKALEKLQLPNHKTCLVTGIGCSSRIAGYIDVYSGNFLHGRLLPILQGVKLAKPELTAIGIGGDGDLFAIGSGHLPHAVRRNLDITCIMVNNFIYALTKGQTSPTTPHLDTGEGVLISGESNSPVDPVLDMISFSFSTRASFIAQGIANDVNHLSQLIEQGVLHKGFSFISVLSQCVIFQREIFDKLRKKTIYLKDGIIDLPDSSGRRTLQHDPVDIEKALKLAGVSILESPYLGVFFKGEETANQKR